MARQSDKNVVQLRRADEGTGTSARPCPIADDHSENKFNNSYAAQ